MEKKLDDYFGDLLKSVIEESVFFVMIKELKKNLKKLKPQFIIESYRLNIPYLTIEVENKTDKEWFLDIHLYHRSIEFISKDFEYEIFFDSKGSLINYIKLLKAFFKGEYQVVGYYKKAHKFLGNCIIWNDDSLSGYNQHINYLGLISEKKVIKNKYKSGLQLIN